MGVEIDEADWSKRFLPSHSTPSVANPHHITVLLLTRDGWMDGWMDGYIDGCMDGWIHGWMQTGLSSVGSDQGLGKARSGCTTMTMTWIV